MKPPAELLPVCKKEYITESIPPEADLPMAEKAH